MGWAGDSSVRLHSRVSGGGCAQQGSQEVKIALPADPQRRVPGRALGFGPGAILGPGRVTFPGGRPPPSPPPPSFPPKAAGHCGSLASRQRKEGRAEAGGGRRRGGRPGGGVLRAGPPMMPKVPDLPLGGPQAQHSSPKPPPPPLPPPEGPPVRRPVCSGRSDPEWLSSGSLAGGAPFSARLQQPGRPLRLMQ